jgi:hypothetical protein
MPFSAISPGDLARTGEQASSQPLLG